MPVQRSRLLLLLLALAAWVTPARAHEKGRPVPAAREQTAGPYTVSFWTTTEVGTGAVYVVVHPRDGVPFVAPTSVRVALRPSHGVDSVVTYPVYAKPVAHGARFSTAVWLDRADTWQATVMLDGPAGHGELRTSFTAGPVGTASVPWIILYAAPFLLVAGLWVRARSLRRSRPVLALASPSSL